MAAGCGSSGYYGRDMMVDACTELYEADSLLVPPSVVLVSSSTFLSLELGQPTVGATLTAETIGTETNATDVYARC